MLKVAFLVTIFALLAGCSGATPAAGGPSGAPSAAPSAASTASSFDQQWAALVKAAQAEGTVSIVGETLGESKNTIAKAFRDKYGIAADIIDGRGAEMVPKIKAERQAGLYLSDIGLQGISTIVLDIKPLGITIPLEPLLVLPEVTDPSKWRGGQLPFIDKERHAIALGALAVPLIIVNSDMVGPGDIKSHMDLLQPKWKGKIAMVDPSTSGTGNNWFTHLVTRVYGPEKGLQFMRDLSKQDIQMTRDIRLFTEWIAKGKYAVGIGQSMTLVFQFKEAGAPIGYPSLAEPPFLSGGSANLIVFDKPAHPNAAKLFANWVMSREGIQAFVPALGYPTLRADVPSDYVDPALVPPPGVTFKGEDDYVRSRAEMRKVAGEIFK